MRSRALDRLSILLSVALLGATLGTPAEAGSRSKRIPDRERVRAYWTAERLASARPLPIPVVDPVRVKAGSLGIERSEASGPSTGWRARPPRAGVQPDLDNYLFDARLVRRPRSRDLWRPLEALPPADSEELIPKARGNLGLDFTSSRLIPEESRLAFPYSTTGKLFFSEGNKDFVCSASVISKRVVLTAGHCVFGDGEFVDDLMFVPAFHEGQAPFGTWTANFVAVADEWADNETVPNAGDWGVMVMDDQVIDGATRSIGQVTGWLGWILNKLAPNHVHVLGYPGNIDRGQRMHQVTTGQHEELPPNTFFYGSDMGGGSSGGPWIQNFGSKGKGGLKGSKNKSENRIVTVTSYASGSGKDEVQGGSEANNSLRQLINEACNDAQGNCQKKGKPKPK